MRLYKVLNKDMTSPFQGFQFELGKKYTCEDFDESDTTCSRGFYATDLEGLPYSWNTNRAIFEVSVTGKKKEFDQYKRRYEHMRIIKQIDHVEVSEMCKPLDKKLGYRLSELINPFNPKQNTRTKLTQKDKDHLLAWASVSDSVRDSVWGSVRNAVRASVWGSVRASVGYSVRASVWGSVWYSVSDSVRYSVSDSVYSYYGHIFTGITNWKYVDHPPNKYPFQPCVDLWLRGFVPSFDGKTWRLHKGENMDAVYEVKL
jgi:hypothetical protein